MNVCTLRDLIFQELSIYLRYNVQGISTCLHDSCPFRFQVTTVGKLFTHVRLCY